MSTSKEEEQSECAIGKDCSIESALFFLAQETIWVPKTMWQK